jgi:phosphoserine aminotransferase
MIKRSKSNLAVIEKFVAQHDWIDFLAKDPAIRSNTSVCLKLDLQAAQVRHLVSLVQPLKVCLLQCLSLL